MTVPSDEDDELRQLLESIRREVAERHHVILGADDPVLFLQTANEFMIRRAATQLAQAQRDTLHDFNGALELASARWAGEGKHIAEAALQVALVASKSLIDDTVNALRAELARAHARSQRHLHKGLALNAAMATALSITLFDRSLAALGFLIAAGITILGIFR